MYSASAPTKSSSPRNANEMQKQTGSFDFILDAVSADHDIKADINLTVGASGPLAQEIL